MLRIAGQGQRCEAFFGKQNVAGFVRNPCSSTVLSQPVSYETSYLIREYASQRCLKGRLFRHLP
jgi:hypothetical protein